MSSIRQEIQSIVKLAREAKDESSFQEKSEYKKFKAKKNGHRSEIKALIDCLADQFDFNNEVIFWSHKFLDARVCNKDEKHRTFYGLCVSYSKIQNYEKTIEYGQKFLDLQAQLQKHYFTLG